MTAKLRLHIGPHKTATTLIQDTIFGARAALADQGVVLASTGEQGNGHHDLAYEMYPSEGRINIANVGRKLPSWDDLGDELRAAPDGTSILVSSENFALVEPDRLRIAGAALAGIEVELIAGVRDPVTSVPSLWQEGVKWSRQWPLDEAATELLASPGITLIPLLGQWADAVSSRGTHVATHLIVVPSRPDATMVMTSLADALDVPRDVLRVKRSGRANVSLSAAHIEAIRAVSISMDPNDGASTLIDRQRVTTYLAMLDQIEGEAPRLPVAAQSAAVLARDALIDQVSAGGYVVHGDLDSILTTLREPLPTPSSGEVVAAVRSLAEKISLARELVRPNWPGALHSSSKLHRMVLPDASVVFGRAEVPGVAPSRSGSFVPSLPA